jgi:hypothetical protein
MKICHACKKELSEVSKKIGRRDECRFCRADLHCCLNCAFYDRASSQSCREPVAERIKDKEKANYCSYFSFAEISSDSAQADVEKARKELNDLFKQ